MPVYLGWSKRGSPSIGMTKMIEKIGVMKVLMDSGSGINILYKDAFDVLKIYPAKLQSSMVPFHDAAWVPFPSWSPSMTTLTFARRLSCLRWSTLVAHTMPSQKALLC